MKPRTAAGRALLACVDADLANYSPTPEAMVLAIEEEAARIDPERPDPFPIPGPYRVEWPDRQGGMFKVMGTGWAIPLVAAGVQSCMEAIAARLNREHAAIAAAYGAEP